MSAFTEPSLEKKLEDLNGSQQSIETLSLWLIHHRKHHKKVAQIWLQVLEKQKHPEKKLILMYLANDVIQNSKRKGPEFSLSFIDPLEAALQHIFNQHGKDSKLLQRVERIVGIWKQRRIYSDEVFGRLEKTIRTINGNGTREKIQRKEKPSPPSPEPPEKKGRSSFNGSQKLQEEISRFQKKTSPQEVDSTETEEAPKPPESSEIIRAILSLENAACTDAPVREKIASLPTEVSDVTMLAKVQDQVTLDDLRKRVEDACGLLSSYNKRLDEELSERDKLAVMLAGFKQHNTHMITNTEKMLAEYKAKLDCALRVREEIKSHANNLPDMSKLPNVSSGRLVPLPTAGDLFTK